MKGKEKDRGRWGCGTSGDTGKNTREFSWRRE
jgi:hypothetical protein